MSKRTIFEQTADGDEGGVNEEPLERTKQLRAAPGGCLEAEEIALETAGNPIQSGAYGGFGSCNYGKRGR